MQQKVRVYIETGEKRVFASAADWPGWCRPGKTEAAALDALKAYAQRYARVATLARVASFPGDEPRFDVVERVKGNGTTDYGAPAIPAQDESKPMTAAESQRMIALLQACWRYLDQVVEGAPQELRKGPRGGGRDRDQMYDHVIGAEAEYAKKIGVRQKPPDGRDKATVRAFRRTIVAGLEDPTPEATWPVPYLARRTAWHALDHAWEIEDRIT
ncbi:MAG TPA: hypothetical protein VGG31_05275 [Candidatus Dormibacteraeota bacterium]